MTRLGVERGQPEVIDQTGGSLHGILSETLSSGRAVKQDMVAREMPETVVAAPHRMLPPQLPETGTGESIGTMELVAEISFQLWRDMAALEGGGVLRVLLLKQNESRRTDINRMA